MDLAANEAAAAVEPLSSRPPPPPPPFFPPSFPSTPSPLPSLPVLPETTSDVDTFGFEVPAFPRSSLWKYKAGCTITCVLAGIYTNVSYSIWFAPSMHGGHVLVGLSAGSYGLLATMIIPVFWTIAFPGAPLFGVIFLKSPKKVLNPMVPALCLCTGIAAFLGFMSYYTSPRPPYDDDDDDGSFFWQCANTIYLFVTCFFFWPWVYNKHVTWYCSAIRGSFGPSLILKIVLTAALTCLMAFASSNPKLGVQVEVEQSVLTKTSLKALTLAVVGLDAYLLFLIFFSHNRLEHKRGKRIENDGFYLMYITLFLGSIPTIAGTFLEGIRSTAENEILIMVQWQLLMVRLTNHTMCKLPT